MLSDVKASQGDLGIDWSSMEDLLKLREEPLDPELEPYLDVLPSTSGLAGMKALRHPLVYQVPFGLAGLANRSLRAKREYLEELVEGGKVEEAVWLHERPHRTEALINYAVGRDEFWKPLSLTKCPQKVRDLAAAVWRDSENLEQVEADWKQMLTAPVGTMLLCDDLDGWLELPETLTVYRGDIKDAGMSWSLDRGVAAWFAQRFISPGERRAPLLTGTVRKEHVVGYLTQRNEAEVVIRHTKYVTITHRERARA